MYETSTVEDFGSREDFENNFFEICAVADLAKVLLRKSKVCGFEVFILSLCLSPPPLFHISVESLAAAASPLVPVYAFTQTKSDNIRHVSDCRILSM